MVEGSPEPKEAPQMGTGLFRGLRNAGVHQQKAEAWHFLIVLDHAKLFRDVRRMMAGIVLRTHNCESFEAEKAFKSALN